MVTRDSSPLLFVTTMNKAIYRYRNILLFTYLGFAGFFLLRLESIFNGGFHYSIQKLWFPLAIVIFSYTWINRKFFYSVNQNKIATWVVAAIFYGLSLLMSWPYVMAINAVTGNGEKIRYEGPIVKKWISKGKHWSYHLDIRDKRTSKTVTLNCNKAFYHSINEGDDVVDTYIIGGLGFPYRWK